MSDLSATYGTAAANIQFFDGKSTGVDLMFDRVGTKAPSGPLAVFNRAPRLNMRQAFAGAAKHLPAGASIAYFYSDEGRVVSVVRPFAGKDEPLLSYEIHSEHQAAYVRRVHAGEEKRADIGSRLFLSQLPLWAELGVRHIDLLAHGLSRGFYEKLGFAVVESIPEKLDNIGMIPMRLDLGNPAQARVFFAAMEKALKQEMPKLALPGIGLKQPQ